MTMGRSKRGEIVGRLFNRAPLSQVKNVTDPFERPWLAQERSPAGVGGFFSLQGDLNKSTKSVNNVTGDHQKLTENRIDDDANEKAKKRISEDYREVVEIQDESSDEGWGWGFEEEAPNERKPLHDSTPVSPCEQTNFRPKTESIALPSAMAKGKRPRQHRHTVSFSGAPMLLEKSNQTDVVLQYDYVDIVDVLSIPHFSQYSSKSFEALWYTRNEIEQIKFDHFYWKRITRSGPRRSSHTSSPPVRRLTSEGRSHNLRFLRHQKTIATVLREQERQRKMCYRIYGRIVDTSGNQRSGCVLDPERLKEVYRRVGKTVQRQEEAAERGRARHLKQIQSTIYSDSDTSHEMLATRPLIITQAKNEQPQEQQQQESYQDLDKEEWSSMEAKISKSCLNVSTPVCYCIHCVFYALLTPFLEQRGQPLFLDVGEEMIVGA